LKLQNTQTRKPVTILSFAMLCITIVLCCFTSKSYCLVDAQEFKTPQGIETILLTDKTTDLISVNIAFKGAGSIYDPTKKKGLAFITMLMLDRGKIGGFNRFERARKLEDLGVIYGIQVNLSSDNLLVSFKVPKENLTAVLQELKQIALFRNFDVDDLNNLKAYIPTGSDIHTTSEIDFAQRAMFSKVFASHPYGFPTNGVYDDIQSLTKSDLIKYLNNAVAKDNMVISVVGDIDKQTLSKQLDQAFAKLPSKASIKKVQPPALLFLSRKNSNGTIDNNKITNAGNTERVSKGKSNNVTSIYKNSPQSGAAFIQTSISINDPDYYALLIVMDILSAGPTSRLFQEIREQRGLVYDVNAYMSQELEQSPVIIGRFKCDNANTKQVISTIQQEWKKIKTHGVTKQEFEDAKTGLIGSYALSFISPDSISSYLLFLRLHGLHPNYINIRNQKVEAVTIKDVNAAAAKYLTPDKLTFVVVGKPVTNEGENK